MTEPKKDLGILAKEFEAIFSAYEELFIAQLKGKGDKIVNDVRKDKFDNFVEKYKAKRGRYISYGDVINPLLTLKFHLVSFCSIVAIKII